ncbi:MAG TPA: AMP-dependent synthetase [Cytophagales bacterium]|nr:AMP-dependent synthetase [Cytophagales bacterium]
MLEYTKDWSARWALYSPHKVAVKDYTLGTSVTYQELHRQACGLANFFEQEMGLQKGDRLMVMAEHSLPYVILFTTAQKMGLVLVPVNYRLAGPEIEFLIKDCEPSVLICQDDFQDKVLPLGASRALTHVWSTSELDQALTKAKSLHPQYQGPEIAEEDPIFILYTSGTTGFPKGALYTHRMLLWNSLNTSLSLEINPNDLTINFAPPFHTGGWNVLLTPFLHRGATVGILKKFDAERVLELMHKEHATLIFAVPTMLKMMLEASNFDKTQLNFMRYFIVGGEALPIPVIEAWHAKGIKIRQGYGLTEVGPNITSLHQSDAIRKVGSIGRPNFYVETKIVNDSGQAVPTGEIGEFCLRGPMRTPGYWQNEEATQGAILDGWFHTGDLVREDAEGYLYVMDRKKHMFISGGENVFPTEVERVLCEHPDVSEVAVVGVPDQKWGEVGKAFVVVKAGGHVSDELLHRFCTDRLAKFKVPKYFELLEELPKNDTGKINRRALT